MPAPHKITAHDDRLFMQLGNYEFEIVLNPDLASHDHACQVGSLINDLLCEDASAYTPVNVPLPEGTTLVAESPPPPSRPRAQPAPEPSLPVWPFPCCMHCGCPDDDRTGHDDTCASGCNDD